MSISTGSIGAGNGLQHSQKIAQQAVSNNHSHSQRTVLNPPVATGVKENLAGTQALAPGAEAKNAPAPSAKDVQQSLEDINKVLSGFSISVQFKVDSDYNQLIIKVVDQDSGKVIRQIPTEDVVRMSKAMENLKGLLFAQHV